MKNFIDYLPHENEQPFGEGEDLASGDVKQNGVIISEGRFPIINGLSMRDAIFKLSISAKPATVVTINGTDFEIGKTGILEFYNIKLQHLIFKKAQTYDTSIMYMSEIN